jgi:hypothetical protein
MVISNLFNYTEVILMFFVPWYAISIMTRMMTLHLSHVFGKKADGIWKMPIGLYKNNVS